MEAELTVQSWGCRPSTTGENLCVTSDPKLNSSQPSVYFACHVHLRVSYAFTTYLIFSIFLGNVVYLKFLQLSFISKIFPVYLLKIICIY